MRLFPLTLNINRWLVMYLIQGTMSMVTNQYYLTSIRLYHAQLRTSALGALFSDITDLLMIMTLAEMGNGFLFCLTQTRTGLQRAVRIASIASCVILSLLAIARFGVSNAVYSQYISDSWYSYTNDTLDESRGKMAGAFSILTFVWALILLVFAAVVFNKTKRNYILKNVSCAPYPLCATIASITGRTQANAPCLTFTDPNDNSSPPCSSSSPLSCTSSATCTHSSTPAYLSCPTTTSIVIVPTRPGRPSCLWTRYLVCGSTPLSWHSSLPSSSASATACGPPCNRGWTSRARLHSSEPRAPRARVSNGSSHLIATSSSFRIT